MTSSARTALHVAAENNDVDGICRLLEWGADVGESQCGAKGGGKHGAKAPGFTRTGFWRGLETLQNWRDIKCSLNVH